MVCTAKGICTMRIHALPMIRTKTHNARGENHEGKTHAKSLSGTKRCFAQSTHYTHMHKTQTIHTCTHTHYTTPHHTERSSTPSGASPTTSTAPSVSRSGRSPCCSPQRTACELTHFFIHMYAVADRHESFFYAFVCVCVVCV